MSIGKIQQPLRFTWPWDFILGCTVQVGSGIDVTTASWSLTYDGSTWTLYNETTASIVTTVSATPDQGLNITNIEGANGFTFRTIRPNVNYCNKFPFTVQGPIFRLFEAGDAFTWSNTAGTPPTLGSVTWTAHYTLACISTCSDDCEVPPINYFWRYDSKCSGSMWDGYAQLVVGTETTDPPEEHIKLMDDGVCQGWYTRVGGPYGSPHSYEYPMYFASDTRITAGSPPDLKFTYSVSRYTLVCDGNNCPDFSGSPTVYEGAVTLTFANGFGWSGSDGVVTVSQVSCNLASPIITVDNWGESTCGDFVSRRYWAKTDLALTLYLSYDDSNCLPYGGNSEAGDTKAYGQRWNGSTWVDTCWTWGEVIGPASAVWTLEEA